MNRGKPVEKVSAIIPVLNEEAHIEELVRALSEQDYPHEDIEFIFVDGGSTDDSKSQIDYWCKEYDMQYSILDNPNRTAPYAFNLGMEYAKGDIIVILSAHSSYQNDYVSKCVTHLIESDADNVGGHLKTVGKGKVGRSIAAVLSSWFGVGGSDFRISDETKYVDTVPFGTFRKELVDRIGGFNVELSRSEDNEFNYRVRKNGGKLLMLSDVEIIYYCRETVSELVKMGFANGKGVGYTVVKYPEVLKLKYFIPMLFTLSLIVLSICSLTPLAFFKWILGAELIVYFLCDFYFTMKTEVRASEKLLVFFLFPLFHISYGLGTICGLFSGFTSRS